MTIAGNLIWKRGLRGFICEKWPSGYTPTGGETPVASYPLNAEQFAMRIEILEQRFVPPKEAPTEKTKLEAQS